MAHIYQPRFCITCNNTRPVKASHCAKCNNCVKRFDHHCTLLNNCIGERNMKVFVGAVFTSWIYALMLCIGVIIYYANMAINGFLVLDQK
mmetsp:Transcript_16177/g.22125  ORF Transcript_16177/g.22125 Transcript_16177/m.22125 type:complete len:90 (+) Transcript_16177:713-982(+)